MQKKVLSGTMAVLLVASLPLSALAEEYDLAQGSITVDAKADGFQYVSQEGGVQEEKQITDTVIKQSDSDTTATSNTITIKAEENTTAQVTISDVNIAVGNTGDLESAVLGEAAISVEGDGSTTIELEGDSTLTGGAGRAALEKSSGGKLTLTDENQNGSLNATGGQFAAGIGGGGGKDGSDITISGGTIGAVGGQFGAGIGGGAAGDGTDITITGGIVEATGGESGAGIGGGTMGNGTAITISGGMVTASGGDGDSDSYSGGGAGIGGGELGAGSDITISGGNVEATGGAYGAGIGGGAEEDGTDIAVSGDAQVKVAGGVEAADIGGGSMGNGEIEPDTDALGDNGSIAYFPPDADKSATLPEKVIHKTASGAEAHEIVSIKGSTATCTQPGTITYVCSCGEEITQFAAAQGHSFTHYVSNGDAGYEIDGTETAYCDHGCGATDTRTEAGSHLAIYRVTDENGKSIASSRSVEGSVLTITVKQENASFSGTTAGLRALQDRGITTVVFATEGATSTFEIADLLSGTAYTLTHTGGAVRFTLDGADIQNLLK